LQTGVAAGLAAPPVDGPLPCGIPGVALVLVLTLAALATDEVAARVALAPEVPTLVKSSMSTARALSRVDRTCWRLNIEASLVPATVKAIRD